MAVTVIRRKSRTRRPIMARGYDWIDGQRLERLHTGSKRPLSVSRESLNAMPYNARETRRERQARRTANNGPREIRAVYGEAR